METRFYGINGAANPAQGVLTAISYGLYRARDVLRSQCSGEKTWERFKGCIATAAARSETVADYVGILGSLIAAPTLPPALLAWIVQPEPKDQVVLYYVPAAGEDAGHAIQATDLPIAIRYQEESGSIQEVDADLRLSYGNYQILVKDACARQRLSEYELLDYARGENAIVIATLCQIKAWETKTAKIEIPDLAIEVTAEEVKNA